MADYTPANDIARDVDPVLALMVHWRNADRKLAEINDLEEGRVFPKQSARFKAASVEELLAIERQIARTPAATLAGAIAKLEIALICWQGQDPEEVASEHALAITALEDLRRLARDKSKAAEDESDSLSPD
jgi:hypothetical protein